MKKINKHIEIVRTQLPGQSSMGQKSCLMIQAALSQRYERVGVTYVSNESDLHRLVDLRPDLAFLGLKRLSSDTASDDSIWVSEHLAANGINYTGSDHMAIALDLNKNLAKDVVAQAGLSTAQYFMAAKGQYTTTAELPTTFPLFIKPPTQGGGKGIDADSIVHTFQQYENKVQQIDEQFGTAALVETYLEGREFSVALIGSGENLMVMPIELIAGRNNRGDRILSAETKSADTERVVAVAAGPVRTQLIQFAQAVYYHLGARDYGRIDIRMDAHGAPHFLEANLVPGVAKHDFTSYFTSACVLNEHMSYEAMIMKITETSFNRSEVVEELEVTTSYVLPVSSYSALSPLKL